MQGLPREYRTHPAFGHPYKDPVATPAFGHPLRGGDYYSWLPLGNNPLLVLREKVIEAWATALAESSFEAIAEIRKSQHATFEKRNSGRPYSRCHTIGHAACR